MRAARAKEAHVVRGSVAAIAVMLAVLPLFWVIRLAFLPSNEFVGVPPAFRGGFTLDNFSQAINDGGILTGIKNSFIIVSVGSVGATVLAAIGGYALAKLPVPGRRLWLALIAVTIAVPLPAIMIPLFDAGLKLGYTDSVPGLMVVYVGIFSAWGTYFMFSYYRGLPDALLESARVDGSGDVGTFCRIALPLSLPALGVVLMFNFFIQWSELILALILLPDASRQTVMVKVALYGGEFDAGGPAQAAGFLIAALPVFVVFALGQRFLRGGIFGGAIKA